MPLGRMKKLLGAAFFTVSVFGFVLDLLLLNHPHLGRGLVWPLLMGAMAAGTLAARIKRTRLYPPIHLILLAVTCLAFILPYTSARLRLLAEDSLAASRLQSGGLCCRVLFVGRNACVADEHGCGKVSPMTLSLQYLFATQNTGVWVHDFKVRVTLFEPPSSPRICR